MPPFDLGVNEPTGPSWQVLYFLAFQNENMFEGGKWKQPISPYGSREREGTTRRGGESLVLGGGEAFGVLCVR